MYYAVQVKSGTEGKVIRSIQDRVNPKYYEAIFTPYREMSRKVKGEWIVRKEIMFPGYIFINSNDAKNLSTYLVKIPEFARVLGKDTTSDGFVPLNDVESRTIDLLCGRDTEYTAKISTIELIEGKKVNILGGPLYGCEGKIKKVNLHRRQVLVTVEMFSRSMDVLLGIEFVNAKK